MPENGHLSGLNRNRQGRRQWHILPFLIALIGAAVWAIADGGRNC
jgi:hypothetical protein